MIYILSLLLAVNLILLYKLVGFEDLVKSKEYPTPHIDVHVNEGSTNQPSNTQQEKKPSNTSLDINNFKKPSSTEDDWLNAKPQDTNF